ncbi:MAG TPA: dihydrofolate reductase family protein [Bacteroidia bacterium]|nr:dihydrofolate reductase family protein [Bacteroidia bacterium]HRH09459.1 dihydrofolate reductase family protein [Bacteroidia bacterium]
MRKIISFVHVSLDGFVAGPNGEMDWIKLEDEIFDHVEKRISKSDTALYGRVTYELMESYWPTAADKPNATKHDKEHALWYSKSTKVVISRSRENSGANNTKIIGDNLSENILQLKKQPGNELLLFGSPSATHSLMQLNLIDGYWLFVNPVVLGKGIPLFANIQDKTLLTLQSTKVFECGVVELNYTA